MRQLVEKAPGGHALSVEWDGTHVFFHRPSGKTHVFNEQTLHLLERILAEPQTYESATRDLAAYLEVDCNEQFAAYVGGLLDHLEELGLVLRS